MDKYFSRLAKITSDAYTGIKTYIRRLLFPLYLFPIKIFTYSAYYCVKLAFRFTFSFIKMIFDAAVFPFKSLKNFFKSAFIFIVVVYIFASLFVIVDYITENYGYIGKFMCFPGVFIRENKSKVVRVLEDLEKEADFL